MLSLKKRPGAPKRGLPIVKAPPQRIWTLDDLGRAPEEMIEEARAHVTVRKDLDHYLKWIHSAEGQVVDGSFSIGHRKRGLGIHPSAIAKKGICPLKVYYDCTGEVEADANHDHETLEIWDEGTVLHCLYQTHFHNMYGEQFEDEVWIRDALLHVESHADGRFRFPSVRFLLEIKTIKEGGNFGYEKVQLKPFEDNVRQLMTYMHFDDCPFGLILYINKNTSRRKEHVVTYDREMWSEIEQFVKPIVDAAYNGGATPEPKVGPHCKRCEYYHGCPHGKASYAKAGSRTPGSGRLARRPRVGGVGG